MSDGSNTVNIHIGANDWVQTAKDLASKFDLTVEEKARRDDYISCTISGNYTCEAQRSHAQIHDEYQSNIGFIPLDGQTSNLAGSVRSKGTVIFQGKDTFTCLTGIELETSQNGDPFTLTNHADMGERQYTGVRLSNATPFQKLASGMYSWEQDSKRGERVVEMAQAVSGAAASQPAPATTAAESEPITDAAERLFQIQPSAAKPSVGPACRTAGPFEPGVPTSLRPSTSRGSASQQSGGDRGESNT